MNYLVQTKKIQTYSEVSISVNKHPERTATNGAERFDHEKTPGSPREKTTRIRMRRAVIANQKPLPEQKWILCMEVVDDGC